MDVQFIDRKIAIFQRLLTVNNEKLLENLQQLINTFLVEYEKLSFDNQQTKPINFDEWNLQFEDNRSLSVNLPELGITLGEFRKQIYEAEFGNFMTLPEFENSVKRWKTKKEHKIIITGNFDKQGEEQYDYLYKATNSIKTRSNLVFYSISIYSKEH